MPAGIFRGITTNPLLAARAGLDYARVDWGEMAQRAADLGAQELHGQVFGSAETYRFWADTLLEAGSRANLRTVVKVPLTESAIRQVPDLKARGCPILMTACYSSKQMVVAAALGADYIAPYYGRMDEAGLDAFGTMSRIMHVAKLPDVRTRVLVASLRRVEQLNELAALGCDCFTLSPELATALLSDEHSDRATAEFERAAGN